MYKLDHTVVAVSSATSEGRVIVRISGPAAVRAVNTIFNPQIAAEDSGIFSGRLIIEPRISIDAQLYLFREPHSYTGDTIVELHFWGNAPVMEALLSKLLEVGVRPAEAGEFTARAYLNGKMDLSQAEAVNEIISGSNRLQVSAAQRLLQGRLAETVGEIREQIADLLSLLEAGMDFSEADIEFISGAEAANRLSGLVERLQDIICGSISYESVIDLPSVGLAGAPNAGKSSLLNSLLESERSIVSGEPKTTRDVLAGQLALQDFRCVLFDCAGLTLAPEQIIDTLAQQAAIEAIGRASVVLFCADVSKNDWGEDKAIYELAQIGGGVIGLATKADLLSEYELYKRVGGLEEIFGLSFMPTSVVTGQGLTQLRRNIDAELSRLFGGAASEAAQAVAITARHRQAVSEAVEDLREATGEVKAGSGETASVMLRAAYKGLGDIEHEHIDEKVLENIFSRFCIGK
jgi:tRNA modification GTPase